MTPHAESSSTQDIVRATENLGTGLTLVQELPAPGTPGGLHDFVLVSKATDDELRDYAEHYKPEEESIQLTSSLRNL
jgi:hypothetical protein